MLLVVLKKRRRTGQEYDHLTNSVIGIAVMVILIVKSVYYFAVPVF